MNATDELCAMLDERGVEWKEHRHVMPGSMAIQRETLWGQPTDVTSGKPIPHVYHYRATEMGDGRLFLEAQLISPKQAVAATLGAGTCVNIDGEADAEWFTCSECNTELRVREPFNAFSIHFCPNCGRRVVTS